MAPDKLLREAEEIKDIIRNERRELHKIAETGFNLKQTLAFVKNELIEMGITPVECGKAGVVALLGNENRGKVFLLRADMDALPFNEETELEFSSKNGNMHACGHDMHTAMLLGAARLLKSHEAEINGRVKLMFQPAEEILEGAKDMIEAGVLENPQVDAAMMLHVMAGMPFPSGTVIISPPGITAPAADYFEIKVQGKGCHGSMPNSGVDPLTAAAHILIALQEIGARELALDEQAVMTIGQMEGGTAANVIPDVITMRGAFRTFDEKTRNFIKERIAGIAENIAASFRAKASVTFDSGCPALLNNPDLVKETTMYIQELLGDELAISAEKLQSADRKSKPSGSEDFAYISHKVPSVMLALAAGHPEQGYEYPQHHPKVKFDEKALAVGSASYAYTALRWLQEHGLSD